MSGSAAANENVKENNVYEIFTFFLLGKLVTLLIKQMQYIQMRGFQAMLWPNPSISIMFINFSGYLTAENFLGF